MERRLIAEYEATLREIAASLTSNNHALALELASLPDKIRDFGHIKRRNVKTGISNVTQTQIAEGLAEGDSVALPTDVPLKPGERVQPIS